MKSNYYRLLGLLLVMLLPLVAQARPSYGTDHFKSSSNYDAYSMGNGKIHYKPEFDFVRKE